MKSQEQTIFNVRLESFISIFLVICITAIYLQVRNYSFNIFDDYVYITENLSVRSGINLESIKWAFSLKEIKPMYWHPLTWISHMLDVSLYGLQSGDHHLVNFILHIFNSIILFYLFRRITGDIWSSALVALLFSIHPLNVESVAWIAARKNVLSTFFWLVTTLLYTRYVKTPNLKKYLLTLTTFALGLLAKPMLVTLPFILLLLDLWPLDRIRFENQSKIYPNKNDWLFQTRKVHIKYLVIEKIPFVIIAIIVICISLFTVDKSNIIISFDSIPIMLRIQNGLVSYINYIIKMLWPFKLAIYYPFPKTIALWKVIASTLILVLVSVVSIRLFKRKPYIFVGWFWFMGTLVPVSGLVQAGLWPAMADRWAYVPLIGIFISLSWMIPDIIKNNKFKKYGILTTIFIITMFLMIKSWSQTQYWSNSFKSFKHAINVTENNSVAYNNLGIIYAKNGRLRQAILYYREAIKINPKNIRAYNNLGSTLLLIGEIDESIKQYQITLNLKPDYADAYYNMGIAYFVKGDMKNAILNYQKSIEYNSTNAKAYTNLGAVFEKEGMTDKALEHYKIALRLNEMLPEANYLYANAMVKKGMNDVAIIHYKKVLKVMPQNNEAKKRLKSIIESLNN